jgi:dCTP deaminase
MSIERRDKMILCDSSLKNMIQDGDIVVEPITDAQIQPASIDLRLGNSFAIHSRLGENKDVVDIREPYGFGTIEADEYVIPANAFVLATTMEYLKIPNYLTAWIEGRSSIGRKGLFVQNAGWIDPGFEGEITLELFNANPFPVRIHAGDRVCQLIIAQLNRSCTNPYRGKYQGQRGATMSRVDYEFRKCTECKKIFDSLGLKTIGTPEGVMVKCPHCGNYTPA